MKWVTSDNHFYHGNIIKYCDRPFKDFEEMNNVMITKWNRFVHPQDIVYHLGDFALCGPTKKKGLLESLNGFIILILGNHDKGKQHNLNLKFIEVHDYLVLGNNKLILSHRPIFYDMETLNVSVENWNYYPIPLPKSKEWVQLCGHSHNNYLMRCNNE